MKVLPISVSPLPNNRGVNLFSQKLEVVDETGTIRTRNDLMLYLRTRKISVEPETIKLTIATDRVTMENKQGDVKEIKF